MKKIVFCILTTGVMAIIGCDNSSNKSGPATHEMATRDKDSTPPVVATDDKEVKAIAITYTHVNTAAAASFKKIVDQYLEIKNALARDNGGDAASASKAMEGALGKLDKSLLTADQKKAYDGFEDDLKEHAEHIGKNGDNIKHQRTHFSMMSEDVYDLVKAFGGGRELYHDYCPMYNENKGAMWISELKEIKNPYLGASMPTCGSVEEVIK